MAAGGLRAGVLMYSKEGICAGTWQQQVRAQQPRQLNPRLAQLGPAAAQALRKHRQSYCLRLQHHVSCGCGPPLLSPPNRCLALSSPRAYHSSACASASLSIMKDVFCRLMSSSLTPCRFSNTPASSCREAGRCCDRVLEEDAVKRRPAGWQQQECWWEGADTARFAHRKERVQPHQPLTLASRDSMEAHKLLHCLAGTVRNTGRQPSTRNTK